MHQFHSRACEMPGSRDCLPSGRGNRRVGIDYKLNLLVAGAAGAFVYPFPFDLVAPMKLQRWAYTGRRPRHSAAGDEALTVAIERSAGLPAARGDAQLVDLSRHGARLLMEVSPAENEPIVFRLSDKHTGLDLSLPGAVRWLTKQDDGRWLIGCEFETELSLETLGELFLCGILSDRPSE
jgi:hypothetical protein